MRLGTATALLAIAGAITVGGAAPAAAQTPQPMSWSPELGAGERAGITLESGDARLDPNGSFLAPVEDGSMTEGAPVPTGLLTLAPHRLDALTDRVGATVLGDVPADSTAVVDVRGRRSTGGWTEWIPAAPTVDGPTARLPEPTSEVQSRLVLTGPADGGPSVRGITLTAHPTTAIRLADRDAEQLPLHYRVFATREGLAGGTTANGHVIAERDHFVALPSRRALAPRGSSDYAVKVCAPNGRCAFAPVWDVGPWNTRDDYWNPPPRRQEWRDLPQGLPQAQAAHKDGYNGGRDQYDRAVLNPAGIDLGDGLFWDALGLEENTWVSVDYLWTGSLRLAKVTTEGPVLAAPHAAAAIVGTAADRAAVPVECVLGSGTDRWLRVGVDQYLSAAAVPDPGPVGRCAPAEGGPADGPAPADGTADGTAEAAAGEAVPAAGASGTGRPASEDAADPGAPAAPAGPASAASGPAPTSTPAPTPAPDPAPARVDPAPARDPTPARDAAAPAAGTPEPDRTTAAPTAAG